LIDAEDFESVTGKGIFGNVGGRSVAVGNRALMEERAALSESAVQRAEEMRGEGQTVMFVAVDGVVVGLLGIADPIKETTSDAIRQLHEDGMEVVMLTGDSHTTAAAVARRLGIDHVVAEVLPDQKADVVKRFQAEGRVVAMAGDGINDAPALAQAQVGIAMGTGTDVAMESAGVTLVKGDLRGIVRARVLSRATMRNIRQNLFFAFVYNALGIPIAAGALYPVFGLLLSPMVAAAAMSFSSVSVIANALRLRKLSFDADTRLRRASRSREAAGDLQNEGEKAMIWIDPVCGMRVGDPRAPRQVFNGVEYRFCMEMCRHAFLERPGRYLKLGEREERYEHHRQITGMVGALNGEQSGLAAEE
jgi:Cu+-exporting ATPase